MKFDLGGFHEGIVNDTNKNEVIKRLHNIDYSEFMQSYNSPVYFKGIYDDDKIYLNPCLDVNNRLTIIKYPLRILRNLRNNTTKSIVVFTTELYGSLYSSSIWAVQVTGSLSDDKRISELEFRVLYDGSEVVVETNILHNFKTGYVNKEYVLPINRY